jgi:hypothetical protein
MKDRATQEQSHRIGVEHQDAARRLIAWKADQLAKAIHVLQLREA